MRKNLEKERSTQTAEFINFISIIVRHPPHLNLSVEIACTHFPSLIDNGYLQLKNPMTSNIHFPPEVLRCILSFLSLAKLKRLHTEKRYGKLFNDIVESLLFRRVSYGGTLSETILGITLDELGRLASGELRCQVQYLEIRKELPFMLDERAFQQYKDFFLSAQKIDFNGDPVELKAFALKDATNILLVHIYASQRLDSLAYVPQCTESLEVEDVMEPIKVEEWPPKLKHLTLVDYETFNIEYPDTLELLTLEDSDYLWTTLPENLGSLAVTVKNALYTRDPLEFSLPSNLTELSLHNCGIGELAFLSKVPHLTKLDLRHNFVRSLKWKLLPQKLEILNLSENKLHSLKKVKFPLTLKELYVANNRLRTLKYVRIPKLTHLDISIAGGTFLIKYSDKIVLPPTLHTLNAKGQYKIDWRNTTFPKSLRNLSVEFREAYDLDYSNLEKLYMGTPFAKTKLLIRSIPETLVELAIVGGKPTRSTLELPNLKKLTIDRKNVPRTIPPNLDSLALTCQLRDLPAGTPPYMLEQEIDWVGIPTGRD